MSEFKTIYKNDYNKIKKINGDKQSRNSCSKKVQGEDFTFTTKFSSKYKSIITTISNFESNKNERYEHKLLCKK